MSKLNDDFSKIKLNNCVGTIAFLVTLQPQVPNIPTPLARSSIENLAMLYVFGFVTQCTSKFLGCWVADEI